MKKYLWIGGISFLAGFLIASFLLLSPEKPASYPIADKSLAIPNNSGQLFGAQKEAVNPEQALSLDFVRVVDKVSPAVVSILAEKVEQISGFGLDEGWPFEDFWDRFFGTPQRPRDRQREYRTEALGTGFFISPDGYILTNNHIIEGAVKITVKTSKGKEYEAKLVGRDAATDLALLKIEGKDFPYAVLGDSSAIKVGEWVLAIGSPFGMDQTVTA
ncbi:MAG: trypsin-like peptidase domain-containing protein, partial [Candidatus Saccharicenans sp.]